MSQETLGEDMAMSYLQDPNPQKPINEQSPEPAKKKLGIFDYIDNKIYGRYSENSAQGKIDFVMEIPKIKLRQCVFTGTKEQIKHDLNCWLPVSARPNYVLGETHYCVYIHNATNGTIRISEAQENLTKGDLIVITKNDKVFVYTIESILGKDVDSCETEYADNYELEKDTLIILTCGQKELKGKNLVIESKLKDIYSREEWDKIKETVAGTKSS